jgi:hypothetical protein
MMADRKKIPPKNQSQMYILFLKENTDPNMLKRRISETGGKTFQYFSHQSIILSELDVKAAESLKGFEGIKHIGPVTFNTRVRKLTIKTDSTGRPLWDYKVDDNNNLYRIKR